MSLLWGRLRERERTKGIINTSRSHETNGTTRNINAGFTPGGLQKPLYKIKEKTVSSTISVYSVARGATGQRLEMRLAT
ncbi:MAG TPA: hypothetical protein VNV85_16295, partial [Puia sp.]|nr:hypothetical protein [Puia sp.]